MANRAQIWARAFSLLLIPALALGCPGKSPTATAPGNGTGSDPQSRPSGGSGEFGTPVFPSGRPYGPPPPSPLPPGVSPPPPTPHPQSTVSPLGDPSATPVANPSPTPTPIAPSPTPPPEIDPFVQPPKGLWVDSYFWREGDSNRDDMSRLVDFGTPKGITWGRGAVSGLFVAFPGPLGENGASGAGVAQITEEIQDSGKVKRLVTVVARSVNVGGPSGDAFVPMKGVRGLASDPIGERLYLIEGPQNALRLGVFSTVSNSYVFVPHAGGSGTAGYTDLVGANARFNDPWGVAVDAGGNAYVTDRGNHCIRKVTMAQVVTTLAGGGVGGFTDGNGKSARFQDPQGICIDAITGTLYVADKGNHAIRRISPEGQVSTFAGGNRAGFKNGQGRDAEFNSPSEMIFTDRGLVVWDEGNSVMRLIDADGKVTTCAGDGTPGKVDGAGQSARLAGVSGMTLDPNTQRVYFAESPSDPSSGARCIRVLDPSNFVDTVAGFGRQAPPKAGFEADANAPIQEGNLPAQATEGFADGSASSAKFNEPWGIAVTDDYVAYVADSGNHAIRKIGVDGLVSTLAGNGTAGFADGTGHTARFNSPRGLALDRQGNLIVADQANHRIRKVTPAGVVTTVAGDGTAGFRDGAGSQAQFNNPRGVAVDLANQIYVADTANHRVRVIATDGTVSTYAGEGLSGYKDGVALLARFSSPVGVAVTHQGKVYVADYGNSMIRAIIPGDPTLPPSPDPNASGASPSPPANPRLVESAAGNGKPGWTEGAALTEARFNNPWALATDSKGITYIADYGNSLIRKFDAIRATVSLFAGFVPGYPDTVTVFTVPTSGLSDGKAGGAAFAAPAGLALDRRGYLWVSDSKNHRVRIIR